MTLLSTTTLSGASTTISSISGAYKDLVIVVYEVNPSASVAPIMKPNNATNCRYVVNRFNVGQTGSLTVTDLPYMGQGSYDNRTDNGVYITINNYASTDNDYKPFLYYGTGPYEASSYMNIVGGGTFYSTTAISSLVFSVPSGTQTGTVLLYGVN